MKLSISNLAIGNVFDDDVLNSLVSYGVSGVEIAPTAVWGDLGTVSLDDVTALRSHLGNHGLAVSGTQSLLYGCPQLQLFDRNSHLELRKHLFHVFDLTASLNAPVAVFGSPKNRRRDSINPDTAIEIAAEFISTLCPRLRQLGIILTLEPNAPQYGADFLTTYLEVVRLVDYVNDATIQAQIDTGCLEMVDEPLLAALGVRLPAHVHVSSPQLVPLLVRDELSGFCDALSLSSYAGWVVLEMLKPEHFRDLERSLGYFTNLFASEGIGD